MYFEDKEGRTFTITQMSDLENQISEMRKQLAEMKSAVIKYVKENGKKTHFKDSRYDYNLILKEKTASGSQATTEIKVRDVTRFKADGDLIEESIAEMTPEELACLKKEWAVRPSEYRKFMEEHEGEELQIFDFVDEEPASPEFSVKISV